MAVPTETADLKWLMYVDSHADGRPVKGFLSAVDVDAGDDVTTGRIAVTLDLDKAIKFRNIDSVLSCWRMPSTRVPLRPDGEPNRPLTALTIVPMVADPESIQKYLTAR